MRIEPERYHRTTGKTEREIGYYITGFRPDASRLNQAIRHHWASKTSYTEPSMSPSEKTWSANAPAMSRGTSSSSTASPATSGATHIKF